MQGPDYADGYDVTGERDQYPDRDKQPQTHGRSIAQRLSADYASGGGWAWSMDVACDHRTRHLSPSASRR